VPSSVQVAFADYWSRFAVRSFRFTLEWKTPISLFPFKGSALRGALGWALHSLVCSDSHLDRCVQCPRRGSCPYALLYESAVVPGERPSNLRDVPKPLVLVPPLGEQSDFAPGDVSTFTAVLVGRAVHLLPALAAATALLGEKGFQSEGRGAFVVRSVTQLQPVDGTTTVWNTIRDPLLFYQTTSPDGLERLPAEPLGDIPVVLSGATTLQVSFYTPMRLEHLGSLCRRAPPFAVLAEHLCQRIDLLGALYAGIALPDPSELLARSGDVETIYDGMAWHDWDRQSSRHGRQTFGGLVGPVVYRGPDLTPFLPFLHAGALLGVGKGTPMGMGRFVISLPEQA
jgi:hypothetical protein